MKKFSILSNSSISESRLAAVSLAACMKKGIITTHTTELSMEAHHEEDVDPREDDLRRRKYLRVIVRKIVV